MKNKISVIGDRDSVMLFQTIGLDVRYADSTREIETAIHDLARQGAPVIYITENAALLAKEAIELYSKDTFPAIIPIPGKGGTVGFGMDGIRKNVEKAIGADILFGEGR